MNDRIRRKADKADTPPSGADGLAGPARVDGVNFVNFVGFRRPMKQLNVWPMLILLIVVLIFGTSRIPELGRGLGEGIKNFKKSIKPEDEEKRP